MIKASCDNSEEETSAIEEAIHAVSSETSVDPRFILAIVIQESKGCVRVHTTNNGVQNTGLMQSHDGAGSCNKGGSMTTPCPSDMIRQMISDGTGGTSAGDGLKQCLAAQSGEESAKYYKAARTYNSGSIDPSGNLGAGIATHCYSSDIANRLTGWAGDVTECVESSISSITSGLASTLGDGAGSDTGSDSGSSSSSSAAAQPSETFQPETSAAPTQPAQPSWSAQPAESWAQPQPSAEPSAEPSAVPSAVPTEPVSMAPAPSEAPNVNVAAQSYTPTPAWTTKSIPAATPVSKASSSSAPIYPEADPSCQQYVTVSDGDFCNKVAKRVGATFEDLRKHNSGLDEECSNLWLGYQYCVRA